MNEMKFKNALLTKVNSILDDMKNNPDKVTESDRNALEKLYSSLCKAMGISEHSQWRVEWRVNKWFWTW